MKATNLKRWLSLLLCVVLIAAMALMASGCSKDTETEAPEAPQGEVNTDQESGKQEEQAGDVTVLGKGATKFTFTVTDLEGKETAFEIHTDKKTVGEALMEHKLIEGEAGPYGLYVKTVNGVTVDYDKDGKYWAFYVNGEYGMTGVDVTEIEAGAAYSFKAE
ncbi:MAG: DUF4430 domain-containing protein [Clostridia bacterium]|nr:DUF4430 domain-containing protein [Clostridia bacterium]